MPRRDNKRDGTDRNGGGRFPFGAWDRCRRLQNGRIRSNRRPGRSHAFFACLLCAHQ